MQLNSVFRHVMLLQVQYYLELVTLPENLNTDVVYIAYHNV